MHSVAFILTMIGGVNWLLVGILNGRDLFDLLGMGDNIIARIVYLLVGVSALYLIFTHKKSCRNCETMGGAPKMGM